ncbi:hypothetical protein INR49_005783, partial [Caranx melampygus]
PGPSCSSSARTPDLSSWASGFTPSTKNLRRPRPVLLLTCTSTTSTHQRCLDLNSGAMLPGGRR